MNRLRTLWRSLDGEQKHTVIIFAIILVALVVYSIANGGLIRG